MQTLERFKYIYCPTFKFKKFINITSEKNFVIPQKPTRGLKRQVAQGSTTDPNWSQPISEKNTVVIYSISALGGEEQCSRYTQKGGKVIRNNPYECHTERTNCKFRAYIRKNQTWN